MPPAPKTISVELMTRRYSMDPEPMCRVDRDPAAVRANIQTSTTTTETSVGAVSVIISPMPAIFAGSPPTYCATATQSAMTTRSEKKRS